MKNTGKEYEKLAQVIYKQILEIEGHNADVKHDVTIQGKDYKHQIDVYWELKVAGITTKYLIEAKDYASPVSIEKIKAFITTVNDIKNSHGIFIAKSGFQKGAKELAEKNGIQIYELRNCNENDFAGKMMKMELKIIIPTLIYDNLNIQINKEKSITEKIHIIISGNTEIFQQDKMLKLKEIIQDLCEENGTDVKYSEYKFEEDTYIIFEKQKIYIDKIGGIFGIKENIENIKINGYEMVGKILFDVINKTYKIFDKSNNYIKDVN